MSLVKVLSLTQPWASLMAWGEKFIETRSRSNRTLVGHDLVIASTLTVPPEVRELCAREPYRSVLDRHGIRSWRQLPLGQLLCRVHIAAMLPTEQLSPKAWVEHAGKSDLVLGEHEHVFGNYTAGRWGYVTDGARLQRLRPIEPALCRAPGCRHVGPRGLGCPCGRDSFSGRAAGGRSTWTIDERYLIPMER